MIVQLLAMSISSFDTELENMKDEGLENYNVIMFFEERVEYIPLANFTTPSDHWP
jgi:hypothetical protein